MDATRPDKVQEQPGPTTLSRVRVGRPGRVPTLLMVSSVVAAAAAMGFWRLNVDTPSAPAPAPKVGSGLVAASPTLAIPPRAPSASSVEVPAISSAPSQSPEPLPPPAPPTQSQDPAELKAAFEQLAERATEAERRLGQVESDVAQLKQAFDKRQALAARASAQARHAVRKQRESRAAQDGIVQPRPQALGVDTWNGQPSVPVLVGSEVRFFSEGDVVADAIVRRADPASQRVEFVTVSGPTPRTAATASRAAGETR